MTRLTCSECGGEGYVENHTDDPADIQCELCGNFVNFSDIYPHLDEGEKLDFDDDGYLCVYDPEGAPFGSTGS
jgi:hypothetical protein